MATFRLHRFANPSTLKAIQSRYLLELLSPHEAYFTRRGLHLGDPLDYAQLSDILMSPDQGGPARLVDDLYYVHELADGAGADELLAAVIAWEKRTGTPAQFPRDLTPAEFAIRVRLIVPEVLERCCAARSLHRRRAFEYFQSMVCPGAAAPMLSACQLRALEEDLNDRLEMLRRGRGCRIAYYDVEDGMWLVIRHGQLCRREATVTEHGSSLVYYRPEVHDLLRYDRLSGDLAISAETRAIGRLYREKVGEHLFGDPNHFPRSGKFTLEPLCRDGERSLVCSDVPGIEWIKLRELQIAWGGPDGEVESHRASDLFAAYRRRCEVLPAEGIAQASFAVQFSDARVPRMVSIRPANVASYARDSDAVVVERWLRQRGFVRTASLDRSIDSWRGDGKPQLPVAHP